MIRGIVRRGGEGLVAVGFGVALVLGFGVIVIFGMCRALVQRLWGWCHRKKTVVTVEVPLLGPDADNLTEPHGGTSDK